jgi:hypothetical protein
LVVADRRSDADTALQVFTDRVQRRTQTAQPVGGAVFSMFGGYQIRVT